MTTLQVQDTHTAMLVTRKKSDQVSDPDWTQQAHCKRVCIDTRMKREKTLSEDNKTGRLNELAKGWERDAHAQVLACLRLKISTTECQAKVTNR